SQQFRGADHGFSGQLQGAGRHRAGRTRKPARNPARKPCAWPRRILRHHLRWPIHGSRRDRVPVPDRRAHRSPTGAGRAEAGMSAYAYSLLAIIGINVMLAVSLNMISGFCGQFSLGHAAFYGTGAYAAALLAAGGSPVPLALAAAVAVAALLGVVV